MSAHTPGPWEVGEDGDVIWGPEWEGRKTFVASVPFNKTPRTEADARLIAAAPELLEVAQRSSDALRSAGIEPRATSDNPLEWLLHQTDAAIAKATGEQP